MALQGAHICRRIVVLALGLCLLLILAGLGQVAPVVLAQEVVDTALGEIVANPEQFHDEPVQVRGTVSEAINRQAFRLEEDGEEITVLTIGRLRRAVEQGEPLVVAGTVFPFDQAEIQREFGVEVDEQLAQELEGEQVILATQVRASRRAATPEAQEPAAPSAVGPAALGLLNQRASMDAEITSENVDQLGLAWRIPLEEGVTGTPLVDDGRLFFTDWGGFAYAADAETGEIIWRTQVERRPMVQWPWYGLAATGTVGNGKYFVASVEGNAWALDQETGEVLWETEVAEDEHAGVLSKLLLHNGMLYMGLQSVEEPLDQMMPNFTPDFRGEMLALDAETGEIVWERQLVEEPHNGVAVWSSFAIDPETNILYFNTGNNYTGEATALSDSMIAANAETGEIIWATQTYEHDVWTLANSIGPDYDFGAGPQLFEAEVNGRMRQLVGAGQKSGLYWVFDRQTGEPVWSTFVGFPNIGGGIRGEASIGDGRVLVWSNNSYIDGEPPDQFPITVKALDAATGRNLWTVNKAQPAVGWAAGFLANDVYFVGSLDGTIKAYSAEDGTVLWEGSTPGAVASSLVVVGDTLYVGAGVPKRFGGGPGTNGVFAFRLGAEGPARVQAEGGEAEMTATPAAEMTPTPTPRGTRTSTPQAGQEATPSPAAEEPMDEAGAMVSPEAGEMGAMMGDTGAMMGDTGAMMGEALGGTAQTTVLAEERLMELPDGPLAWVAFASSLPAPADPVTHSHAPSTVYARGVHTVVVDGETIRLRPGESVVIPAGTQHTHRTGGRFAEILLTAPDSGPPPGLEDATRIFASPPLAGIPEQPVQLRFIEVTLPPDSQTSVHTHPGSEFIYVTRGDIVYQNGEVGTIQLEAGEGHMLPADTAVQKRNPEGGTASFLSWFLVEPDEPFAPEASFDE